MSTSSHGEGPITTITTSSSLATAATTTATTLTARSPPSNPSSVSFAAAAAAAADRTHRNSNSNRSIDIDPQGKRRINNTTSTCSHMVSSLSMSCIVNMMTKIQHIVVHTWKGNTEFVKAQLQVGVVLLIAYIGNNWKYSYPRNDNKNYTMFWSMNLFIAVLGLYTMIHIPNNNRSTIQILSRSQTEEWKGWMQWAFIMYHYYRATNVYNVIRVFVSSYVWMTGFGNFLYFDKKQDFSIERAVSMWLRINYFPILLSMVVGVPFELLYIVPLHTTAFFITMITCYVAHLCEVHFHMNHWQKNCTAISLCVFVHVIFYETSLVHLLEVCFGHEIYFRFSSDKYSAVLGIISGYFWHHAQSFVTWAHTPIPVTTNNSTTTTNPSLPTSEATSESTTTNSKTGVDGTSQPQPPPPSSMQQQFTQEQTLATYGQRIVGVALILIWWFIFGSIADKLIYNPIHPFVFWMPVFGWLLIRNSSKYLTEVHSTALEFFGKITLETYVLQFHVFMCRNVQHIPIILPGSGPDGNPIMKFLNMILTGIGFIALAYWARKITVTTQTTVTDLVVLLLDYNNPNHHRQNTNTVEITSSSSTEKQPLTSLSTTTMAGDEESNVNNNGDHLK